MTRPQLLVIVGILALLGAGGAWLFPQVFKQVEEEVRKPPEGEALYNELYALKVALRAHGQQASSWPNLAAAEHALKPGDSLLLLERPEVMNDAQAQRLAKWVEGGGHLFMPGPPRGATPGPLAEILGLRAVQSRDDDSEDEDYEWDPYTQCTRVLMPGQKDETGKGVWLCDPRFRASIPGYRFSSGDEQQGWRFARRKLGSGMVTISELDFLGNDELRDPAARALAWQVLAPSLGHGRMHLVYSADVPSLLRLLVDHAWMVLIGLVLALTAWLLYRNQRFGPVQPAPEPRRRALLEHVRAAGEFTWSRQRAAALHAAVLRLVLQRMQRRAPEIFALSGEAQEQALAAATSQPLSRVREAMRPLNLQHPNSFTQSIATLLLMRSRL